MSGTYDWKLRRWGRYRPAGMRWSEIVLGRRAVQRALCADRQVVVSAYRVTDGRLFYTDPVQPDSRAGPRVLYRIRVKLKPHVQVPE
jgi:hypothetical protein